MPRRWLLETWPQNTPLGRITIYSARVYSRPTAESRTLGFKRFDEVVPVLRQVVGEGTYPHNHVWTETPDGFIYSPWVQPVFNRPNGPVKVNPDAAMFAEVSVPYVDARTRPEPDAPVSYRIYYSAVFRIASRHDAVDGSIWYRIADENGYWLYAPAEALRPIAPEEVTPLSPEVEDKLIRVRLSRQSLSAFENGVEVFRCPVASGTTYFSADGTPQGARTGTGKYTIWSKRASRHMEGGTEVDGYDLPGVAWVTYFASNGAAIHAAYWHNDFGRPRSHGCLNTRPADALWLYRWTLPHVDYNAGKITVQWPGGTRVIVEK